jgi:phage baseplate assembly protein W
MGYRIISVDTNVLKTGAPTALGISYESSDRVFTSIYTTSEQAVLNLKTLLLTRIGERYGYPQFGTHLLNVIFQPISDSLRDEIKNIITEPVSMFLPYITLDEIDIKTPEDDPNLIEHLVSIRITFSIGVFDTKAILLEATNTGILKVSEV